MSAVSRVFTEGGTVAHLLDVLRSPNEPAEALCGRSPWPGLWHGTGSQEEEERVLDLALCSSCAGVMNFRQGGMLGR